MTQPSTWSELLGPQQSGYDHVAAGFELPVALDHNPRAQVVHDQGLLGLGQAQLPGGARMLDGIEGRRSRSTVLAGDEDHVGMAFGHACGHGSHPVLGDQLDVDASPRVGHLQVMDELLEILDGIDVMVGRRGDELDPRCGAPDLGDPGRNLGAGKVATLPRLGSLAETR